MDEHWDALSLSKLERVLHKDMNLTSRALTDEFQYVKQDIRSSFFSVFNFNTWDALI